MEVTVRKVEFKSGDTKVVGNLYLPTNIASRQKPAVVVVGPQSSVKEQVPAVYAQQLASQGFVALTFDHRTFGESGGEPRQERKPYHESRRCWQRRHISAYLTGSRAGSCSSGNRMVQTNSG